MNIKTQKMLENLKDDYNMAVWNMAVKENEAQAFESLVYFVIHLYMSSLKHLDHIPEFLSLYQVAQILSEDIGDDAVMLIQKWVGMGALPQLDSESRFDVKELFDCIIK